MSAASAQGVQALAWIERADGSYVPLPMMDNGQHGWQPIDRARVNVHLFAKAGRVLVELAAWRLVDGKWQWTRGPSLRGTRASIVDALAAETTRAAAWARA